MDDTQLGILTEARFVQPPKADSPILVTEIGILTDDRLLQPEKAKSLIFVIPLKIVTDFRLIQSWKVYIPKFFTLWGIVMALKSVQLSKARSAKILVSSATTISPFGFSPLYPNRH